MNEEARHARNTERLTECFPAFAANVKNVIADLEAAGFRPRIQDAHRTIAAQIIAFDNGFTKVKFGFHNITGAHDKAESLAVDLLDDDHPLSPSRKYIILLAESAHKHHLQSGAFFGLTTNLKKGLNNAIAAHDFDSSVKIGFDPTHIEVTGITIGQAKAGARPT